MEKEKLEKDVKRHMTSEEVNKLPLYNYTGRICVVRSAAALREACHELKGEAILGFDTESRPSFTKGQQHPVSLVQLASARGSYLFQLRELKDFHGLAKIFADKDIVKAGVALARDVKGLQELFPFTAANFVDLSELAKKRGIANSGLRGLAGLLLGQRISKRAQRTNWARSQLTTKQLQYAATDAWISREIYLALKKEE